MPGRKVVIVGEAYFPELEIGGGPIYPEAPPGIWPPPGYPAHPIAPGGPPPGIWGPPGPWPTPPIYIEIPPDTIDGKPEHPIYIPIYPAHPIVIPPDAIGPGVPAHPIYLPPGIWGPNDPRPTPPIFLPPGAIDPGPPPKPAHPIWLPTYPAHPIVEPDPILPPPEESKMWVVLAIPNVGYKVVQVPSSPGYNPPSGGAVPTPQRGRRG